MTRPNDISQSVDGDFYIAESTFEGSTPRISIRDKQGQILSSWESRQAHGLWVDKQDSVYLALPGAQSVDKYINIIEKIIYNIKSIKFRKLFKILKLKY